jgi:hypothetical protein
MLSWVFRSKNSAKSILKAPLRQSIPLTVVMLFNHRFLLRLITNLVVFALALSSIGILLWTIDEFIGWDILPDAIGIYVRALVIGIAWVTCTLIVIHLLLSLTLFAEASASRAKLPDIQVKPELKRKLNRLVPLVGVMVILLFYGLQAANRVRGNFVARLDRQETEQKQRKEFETASVKFDQIQQDLDQALPQVLELFTPSLLNSIQTNTISAGELRQLFEAVQVSFPHNPSLSLLIPAQSPYRYYKLDSKAIARTKEGQFSLRPHYYFGFPTESETKAVNQLFAEQAAAPTNALTGVFIRNTVPSSWGVLRLNGRAIALVHLEAAYSCPDPTEFVKDRCIHDGPAELHVN